MLNRKIPQVFSQHRILKKSWEATKYGLAGILSPITLAVLMKPKRLPMLRSLIDSSDLRTSFKEHELEVDNGRENTFMPTIRGYEALPKGLFGFSKYIPYVSIHGLRSNRTGARASEPLYRSLHDLGYGIHAYDSPGTGRSGGHITTPRRTARAIESIIADIKVKRRDNLDPVYENAPVLHASSIGALAAIDVAANQPQDVGVLILESPILDGGQLPPNQYIMKSALAVGNKLGMDTSLFNSKQYISKLDDVPIMIIVTKGDPIAKPEQSREFYDAVVQHRKMNGITTPCTLVEVENEQHMGAVLKSPQFYIDMIDRFCRQNIKKLEYHEYLQGSLETPKGFSIENYKPEPFEGHNSIQPKSEIDEGRQIG
ncbi:Serine aminopeptidase, S33 [Seinonella peptonophila]|uniref:Serine aminopeptidase, S33 n=1 Tax=Seinonella peptonophila TaxID=112248 RepID=A0A1M5BA26_9BACL|nr:alpha/beta hydrolase [Seinonella peptonophila]SHF39290.1 Serine aminopeptidase, S33 [Seinonella peptonophila]